MQGEWVSGVASLRRTVLCCQHLESCHPNDPNVTEPRRIVEVNYTPKMFRSKIKELKEHLKDPNAPFGAASLHPVEGMQTC